MPDRHTVWSRSHLTQRKLENGPWLVDAHEAGRYRITLSHWPRYTRRAIASTRARIRIGNVDRTRAISDPDQSTEVTFDVELETGPAELWTWLTDPQGESHGAYFVAVERKR